MATDRLKFFVSSSMSELPDERAAVQRAVDGLEFDPFLYERDAHAAIGSAREQWEEVLADSAAIIVILYRKLGDYTKGEIEFARKMSTPILLYRKVDPDKVIEAEHASYLLELENVETGVSARYFNEAADLEAIVAEDVQNLLADVFERYRQWEQCGVAARRRRAEAEAAGLDVREAPRPEINPRSPTEIERVAEPPKVFVGRDDGVADLSALLGDENPRVAVMGPYGIGRKSLLRHLVHSQDSQFEDRFADGFGVIPKDEESSAEDMLQAIWEIFYDVEDECRPVALVDPEKRSGDLERIRALIVIEDVALSSGELDEVAAKTKRSTLAVTSDMASTDWKGPGVTLRGLDDSDATAVFEAAYGRPLPGGAGESLAGLFAKVRGSPYLIRRLAQQAAQDIPRDGSEGDVLAQWADAVAGMDEKDLAENLVPEEARSAFDAVRTVGKKTPFTVFGKTPGGTASPAAAVKKEAAETTSPQVKVNPALGMLAPPPPDAASLLDEILEAALAWTEQSTNEEIFDNRQFVLRMLDWAMERERWDDVIRLARNTQHAMAVGGRHGAWRRVLEAALTAARTVQPVDVATEAWALHQLGSMALLRDELGDARVRLHEALDKRQAIGDAEGAALSRSNLGLIPMAIVSLALLFLGVFAYPAWVFTIGAPGLIGETPAGELSFDAISFDPVQAPVAVAVRKDLVLRSSLLSDAEFVAAIVDVSGEGAFCVNEVCGTQDGTAMGVPGRSDGRSAETTHFVLGQPLAAAADPPADCEANPNPDELGLVVGVEPGSPCRLVVSFGPQAVGRYESVLTFTNTEGEVVLSVELMADAVPPSDTTTTSTPTDTRALGTTSTTEADGTTIPGDITTTTTTTSPPDDDTTSTSPPVDVTTSTSPPVDVTPTTGGVSPDGGGGGGPDPSVAGIDIAMTARVEPAAIVYDYVITNTGDAPLQSVRITGGLLGDAVVTCGESQLDSGVSTGCSSVYPLGEATLQEMVVANVTRVIADAPGGRIVPDAVSVTTEFGVVEIETVIDTTPQDALFVHQVGTADPWTTGVGMLRVAVPEGALVVRQEGPAGAGVSSLKNWSVVIDCNGTAASFPMATGEASFFADAGERYVCRITNSGVAIAEIPTDIMQFSAGAPVRVVEVRNVGMATFAVSDLTMVGTAFGIADDGCTGAVLEPGGRCTVSVEWFPTGGSGWLDVGYAGEVEGDSRVLLLTP